MIKLFDPLISYCDHYKQVPLYLKASHSQLSGHIFNSNLSEPVRTAFRACHSTEAAINK